MQKKAIAFAAAACSLALALGGCGGQGGDGDAADGEMIMNVYGCEPQHPLIPANTNETCGGNPIDMLFAKLVTFDDEGNAQNEVAKEIVANEDSSEYTITLNDGWTFTDGTPVTSESFTKAWSYSANAANGMVNASFFSVIEGYEDLQDPNGDPNAQLSGLTVVDDTTFTVKLTGPNSTFPIRVGYTAYAPLPESFYDNPEAFGESPVGNGQYKFEEWNHNQNIKMVKNPDYKGVAPAQNDGLNFVVYTDPEAAYADLSAGNLDAMHTIPTSAQATFETDENVQPYNEAGSVFQSFTFPSDMEHFKLDDEGRLRRKAISMAIDRQSIVDKVLNGIGTPAVEWSAPVIPGYSDSIPGNEALSYNPEEAKKLWEQANEINPWGDDDQFVMAYNSDSGGKDVYDAMANSISNALGIQATTNPMPTFSEFRDAVSNRTMKNAFRTGWQPDYPSIENYLQPLYTTDAAYGQGANDGDYSNPEFDALITQAAATPDTDEANKLYQQAEEILFQDMPAVPMYYSNASGAAALGVKGFVLNWKNVPVYQELTKELTK